MKCECGHEEADHVVDNPKAIIPGSAFRPCFECGCLGYTVQEDIDEAHAQALRDDYILTELYRTMGD